MKLAAAGSAGSRATVRFQHRFDTPGTHTAAVFLEQDDDLPADNARYGCLSISRRVEAVVVEGGASSGSDVLMLALDPFGTDANVPWPIRPRRLAAERLSPAELSKASVAFFCNVPTFSPAAAGALRQFVRTGGTATFFLGPDVQVGNYNQLLGSPAGQDEPLLPGTLEPAVGQIGPQALATATDFVDVEHPYLAGLYEKASDYKTVLVQRYFPLTVEPASARVLVRLADGRALLATKPYGRGAVVLCTTSAGPQWSNLPLTGIFLPILSRVCLMSAAGGADQSFLAGATVTIPLPKPGGASGLPAGAVLQVTPPSVGDKTSPPIPVPLSGLPEAPQATFTATDQAGIYRWKVSSSPDAANAPARQVDAVASPAGAFAVNGDSAESDLAAMDARTLKEALTKAGWRNVLIGGSLAEVQSAAAARAAGHNWWDLLLALVIVLLVVEAVVANRPRPAATESPSGLKVATG